MFSLLTSVAFQQATAFLNPDARTLLARARAARIGQDSSIREYDASALQRMTLGLAVTRWFPSDCILRSRLGRDRSRWNEMGRPASGAGIVAQAM